MSEPVKKINPSPESYSPKNKPEILAIAENLTTLPESAKIAFAGSINQNGPAFGPHTLAFASAATSLAVLMGAPHDTSVMEAHNTTWRNDNDYYRNLMISGEGFQFWNDVWNYFTDELHLSRKIIIKAEAGKQTIAAQRTRLLFLIALKSPE